LGLEAIKAEGGITFAQDDSAKQDSMPRSAVAAGCVDLVLAPADIARELARIAKHPYVKNHTQVVRAAGGTSGETGSKRARIEAAHAGKSGAKPEAASEDRE